MTNDYFENFDSHLEDCKDGNTEMGVFMRDFFIQTLSTKLLDGAIDVTDDDFLPPSERNNFLLSEDGKKFSGWVTTATRNIYQFELIEGKRGKWGVKIDCEAVH